MLTFQERLHIHKSPPQYFLILRPEHERLGIIWHRRWDIEKGWEIDRIGDDVRIIGALGREEVLKNPMCFGTDKKLATFTKMKLNSEIVKAEEPEYYYPHWAEEYERTHRPDAYRRFNMRKEPDYE